MKINDLLKEIEYLEKNFTVNFEIESLIFDSNKPCKDAIFFLNSNSKVNSEKHIKNAIKNGAIVVITNQKPKCKCNYVLCEKVSEIKAKICYKFYNLKDCPKLIGVVGTNGKTTITYLLKHVFEYCNKKVGVIGTLGVLYDDKIFDYDMTTPDAIIIGQVLSNMKKSGVEYCFIEVSAHAICQNRVDNLYFETLIFTNCTHDHLDYFKTFNEYQKVKKSIFTAKNCKKAVINIDDQTGFEIIKQSNTDNFAYGLKNPSDVFAVKIEQKINNLSFTINLFDNIEFVSVNMIGIFNVYNLLATLTASVLNGISLKDAITALKIFKGVSGRNELIATYNDAYVFVDYAHTPDGLKNTLTSFRPLCNGNLIVIFGCGGNRDSKKRSIMGEIAGKYADFVIITSDNPRNEEPLKIIKQIEEGVVKENDNYVTIENRYLATLYGVKSLNCGDILCVVGKGAETSQEIKGKKIMYSDKDVITKIINNLNGGDIS